MNQGNPRHLNYNKFIEERSIEISKFINDLEMDTKKKGHQSLPKSIRRRAMSHNRYRIPRRMRKNIEDDLAKAQSMQRVPKCRKHIRKRRHLIMAYKMRDSKTKWLSTHLWSARRMRMINYYGYKIAHTSNNKCFRSAYRHFRHNCCLLDLSYLNCLSIKAETLQLPNNIQIKHPRQQLKKDILYQIQIFKDKEFNHLICPAFMIMNAHNNHFTFKIFFHPIALQEIKIIKLETSFQATLQQNLIDIYLLIGPQSQSILESALAEYGLVHKGQQINNAHYHFKNQLTFLSSREAFSIVNKPMVTLPIPQEKQIKSSYSSAENSLIRRKMLKMYEEIKNYENEDKKTFNGDSYNTFWRYYEQGQNSKLQSIKFRVTLRSKYTHKRTNKITKEQKKKIIKEESQDSKEGKKRKSAKKMKDENEISSESQNMSKLIHVEAPINKQATLDQVNPVVFSRIGEGLMSGIMVFSSNANSCRLWRIMSLLNVKVIGRRQYAHFHLESNARLFPQDYVGTESFNKHLLEQQNNLFSKYKRMPIFKRPHYVAINSNFPFGFPLSQSIKTISILMVGKGKCFDYSYICELLMQDLNKISDLLSNGKVGIIASELIENDKLQRNEYGCKEDLYRELQLVRPIRKIVGFITSGGYIFDKSREGGRGVVDYSLMNQKYLSEMGGYVLIRKPTSKHYYLGQLTQQQKM